MNLLLTNSTEFYSGGELFVFQVAAEMKKRGHAVVVSARPGHLLLEKCAAEGIAVEPVRYGKTIRYMKAIHSLRLIIRRHAIQLVHSNSDYDRTYAGFAAALCGVPHVANIHSQHSIRYNPLHRLRNRFAIDHFLVDGEPTRKILAVGDEIPAEKITLLRLGIDVRELEPGLHPRMEIRKALGIGAEVPVVGNVARLVPFKGHSILLSAAKEILAAEPNTIFLLIGDGPLRGELELQARELGISDSLRFLGFRDDLPRLYAAMDIYVHSSLDDGGESFPLAVLQALASGLPVVASIAGDIPLMLDEGRNGPPVPAGNAGALAGALMDFLRNSSLRRETGARGAAYVRRHFTTERMVDAIEEVYRRLVKE